MSNFETHATVQDLNLPLLVQFSCTPQALRATEIHCEAVVLSKLLWAREGVAMRCDTLHIEEVQLFEHDIREFRIWLCDRVRR